MENQTSQISLNELEAVRHAQMLIEACAELAHNANRAYCQMIGDDIQPKWGDAPDWQKNSARQGVAFHLDNPDAGASASHNSWLKQKREEGWVYGPVKDADAKTHPCYLPYDALPMQQRVKDYIFAATVKGFFTV